MRSSLSLPLLLLATALALVSGCGRRGAGASAKSAAALRISQRNEPVDLDPATASLPDEFFVIRALGEGLLVPDPAGGDPLPAAADGYRVSADGLTYSFHLRPGLTWSNGEPLTASDFVASFERVLTPATAAPKAPLFYLVKNARAYASGTRPDFNSVGVRAPDPETVEVTLEHASAGFPRYVATGAWIPVNPRVVARWGRRWTQPEHYVGNGPFVLTEWRPGQRIVVRRNPQYWSAASIRLAEIQFVRFDDQDSEERAFRAGEIDVTLAVPQNKLERYAREHPELLHRAPLAETRFLSFNVTRPPFNDERVRRAFSLALDRQKLVTLVLRGHQPAADRLLSPALLGGESAAPASDLYAPGEARRLLAVAGFPAGRGFPAIELSGWDRNPILEAMQQVWQHELGIQVQLVVREAKVHLAALHEGNYDVAFVTNLLDVRDPVAALADFTTGAPNNFPHWHSDAFDAVVHAAEAARDQASARREALAAEKQLLESAAIAPVYFNVQNWLMAPRVHGWEQDALWTRRYNDAWLE